MVGEDWHAISQAKASRERSGKTVLQMCGNSRAVQSQGQIFLEGKSGRQIESRVAVRQVVWKKHLQSSVSALEETLRSTAAGGERAESSAAGGITRRTSTAFRLSHSGRFRCSSVTFNFVCSGVLPCVAF